MSYRRAASRPPRCTIWLQKPGLRHRHIHSPIGQRGPQCVARLGLADAGDGLAAGVGQQRITALQHEAGVQQFQSQGGTLQPLGVLRHAALQSLGQLGLQRLLALRQALHFQEHPVAHALRKAR